MNSRRVSAAMFKRLTLQRLSDNETASTQEKQSAYLVIGDDLRLIQKAQRT